VISNIAFQCAKLYDLNDRNKLKDWILNFEYNYNNLPVPDLNIFLDVPFDFTASQLSGNRAGEDRNYLLGNRDIHEDDLVFQKRVRDVYLSLENKLKDFQIINCSTSEGKVLPPTEIFNKILNLIV
jgi:dTMP kinase